MDDVTQAHVCWHVEHLYDAITSTGHAFVAEASCRKHHCTATATAATAMAMLLAARRACSGALAPMRVGHALAPTAARCAAARWSRPLSGDAHR